MDSRKLTEMPAARLSNGIDVANFSSGHPFVFEDGTVLEACKPDRTRDLALLSAEAVHWNPNGWYDVEMDYEMTTEVRQEMLRIEREVTNIDIVITPRVVLEAAVKAGMDIKKFRTGRKMGRNDNRWMISRFCLPKFERPQDDD